MGFSFWGKAKKLTHKIQISENKSFPLLSVSYVFSAAKQKCKTEASDQGYNDHRRTYHLLSGRKCLRESHYSERKEPNRIVG
jgi:hypothetical protein